MQHELSSLHPGTPPKSKLPRGMLPFVPQGAVRVCVGGLVGSLPSLYGSPEWISVETTAISVKVDFGTAISLTSGAWFR